ncbi:MAG: protein kinase [Pirellulaceae bacterium]
MIPPNEQLIRTLRGQLESQLRSGGVGVMERMLDSNPGLKSDVEGALDLIYVEITTREEMGQRVDATELKQRFPQWSERIERLMAVHHALQAESRLQTDIILGTQVDTDVDDLERTPISIPRQIDQYEILAEIGRGGMGVVYSARQHPLNRTVALKLMSETAAAGVSGKRLVHEAKTVASLDHPHIVQIFDAGQDQGRPFICLEYVAGGSLSSQLSKATFDAKSACRLLRLLADGVQYAHEQGVIHRDLKPANILMDSHGQPKIADFGLAKVVWERSQDAELASRLTQTGAILGSLCYMAPEQVSGQSDRIGVTTDIYGLGTILYEMLVGRPPFVRESPVDTAQDIKFRDPISPRTLAPTVPRDVETICLKCLEKDPQRRYASAAQLGDDLDRYLSGQPIVARPVSRLVRGIQWCKRKPAQAALLATLVALPLAYAVMQSRHTRDLRNINAKLSAALEGETQARKQADQDFWRAYSSVESVQKKLADAALEHEPRMQQARLEVVDNAIQLISYLAEQRPDEDRIAREQATLHRLRGLVLSDLGNYPAAIEALSTAEQCFNDLLASAPGDAWLHRNHAATLAAKAETLKWQTDLDGSVALYEQAAQEFADYQASFQDDVGYQIDLTQCLCSWASVTKDAGNFDAAEQRLHTAELRARGILERWPEEARAHSVSAQISGSLATLASNRNDPEIALPLVTQSVASFERALELAPGEREYQHMLVEKLELQGLQLHALHRDDEAILPLQKARNIATELRGRYPAIGRYINLEAGVVGKLSVVEIGRGNEVIALELAKAEVSLQRLLTQLAPNDLRQAANLAFSLSNLASRVIGAKSLGAEAPAQAERYAREALEVHASHALPDWVRDRVEWYARYNLTLALARQDRVEETRRELSRMAELTAADAQSQRFLADAWSELLASLLRTNASADQTDLAMAQTLDHLEQAIEAGWRDYPDLMQNEALDALRDNPQFQSLAERIKPPE